MWVLLALCSSFFLGIYDLLRKSSLKENAVIPVLFFSTLTAAIIFVFLIVFSGFGLIPEGNLVHVPKVNTTEHLLYLLKAAIVSSSWILAYYAIRNLPLTIVIPVRSTGPFWTLLGALIIFGEKFSVGQWVGIVIVLFFFYMFSLAGKKEGINFSTNKWIFAVVGATVLGAISSMFDKYLLMHYDRMAVQAWFSIYNVVILAPFFFFVWFPKRSTRIFEWRWTIPLIGIGLLCADFLYFFALSYEDSLIGVVSILRRSSVIWAFAGGAIIFKEKNITRKAFVLAGILVGVLLIVFSS